MHSDRQLRGCPFARTWSPDGPDLIQVVPSSVAEAVRKKVGSAPAGKSGLNERKSGTCTYDNVTPEKQAKIAKYAAENGIAAAIFSKSH